MKSFRSLSFRVLPIAVLSGCSLLSATTGSPGKAASPSEENQSGEGSRRKYSSPEDRPAAASFTPYRDEDEGVTQPMQSAHEGQIVFSNGEVARKDASEGALVSALVVGKPLYLRAFFPKTAAAFFNAAKLQCADDEMQRRLVLRVTGEKVGLFHGAEVASPKLGDAVNVWKESAHVYRQGMETVYKEVRTATFAYNDKILPVVPGGATVIDNPANEMVLWRVADFLAKLPTGESSIDAELYFGCDKGVDGWVGVLGSKGRLTVKLKAGERTRLGGFFNAPKGNPGNTARLKGPVTSKLGKGESLLDFAAYEVDVVPLTKREYPMSLVLKGSDGRCKHAVGTYTEDYLGPNNFGNGHYFIADDPAPTLVPCD